MEPRTKELYNILVNVVDKNGNVSSIQDFLIKLSSGAKASDNRFNMKTVGGEAVFDNLIPRLGAKWTGKVWTSENTSESRDPDGQNLNRKYATTYASPDTYDAPTSRKFFSYNQDKYLREMLQEPIESDNRISDIFARDEASCNMYGRRNGVLVVDSGNGPVEINAGSSAHDAAVVSGNKCFTTQTTFEGKDCTAYVTDCLRGDNIDKCKKYFETADFWDTTQEEIRNMHPEIALKTLRSFGFKEVTSYHEEHKRNIVKVQEVHEWSEGLRSVTSDMDTIKAITSNDKLNQYLKWVVQLVNCNPSVLNSNFSGFVGGDDAHDPNRFSHTGLAKMGLKARRAVNNSCYKDIDSLASAINRYNITLGIRLNAPIIGGIVPVRPMYGGGSVVTLNQAETSVDTLKQDRKETSAILGKTFQYLVGKLQAFQKDISTGDKSKIEKLINDLAKKEQKLYEVINFVEKYSMLVDVFGEDAGQKTVSVADMEKAVNARSTLFAKKVKRENDIISVLKTLTEALQKETGVESNPQPVGTALGM
jgi:hypothetical protein